MKTHLSLYLCAFALIGFLQTCAGQPVLWSANGHYYEFVPANCISWWDARAKAGQRSYAGLSAHLATITSVAENDFITTNFGVALESYFTWLGGHAPNDQRDGVWQWEAGPEYGIQFSIYQTPTPPFNYANWGGVEPNHDKADENFLMMNLGQTFCGIQQGQWADAAPVPNPSDPVVGYVVEYEPVTAPPPNQLTITKVLEAYQIGFFAETNKSYQVQYVPDVGSTNWVNLGNTVSGDGATKAVFDQTITSVTQRFYRLRISQ
ncbi:MAG: hypothetical protein N3G20_07090 [Verrucomicrobiae bacterium]|nr:hypothetical protein [Verrucomicrobiae bacterium]